MKTTNQKRFCIVIPIYNENPDITEIFSLQRLDKIISGKKYNIIYIKPKSLNSKSYHDILSGNDMEFDDKYFKSPATYSQLLISHDFYKEFLNYDYMLIYQTDCYLFEDNIKKWCDKDYDYIGAPIIAQNPDWSLAKKGIPQVGNGGLSLRKVKVFYDLTDPKGEFMTYYKITDEQLKEIKYEDVWFCDYIWTRYDFNIPSWLESSQFALDMNINYWYNTLNIKYFPMGCHAWPKNIRDWADKFTDLTPEVIQYCENKYKDFFKVYYDNTNTNS